MDRTAFLERFFTMFPQSFNQENIPYWTEAYEAVLNSSRINFDTLFEDMIMNWTSMSSAPSPNWFIKNQSNATKKDDRCQAVIHAEEIKQTSDPMPESFKLKMQELKQKMSKGKP